MLHTGIFCKCRVIFLFSAEITALHLIFLDISGNRIVQLPSRLRLMDSLVELILDNNPLSCPPAYVRYS